MKATVKWVDGVMFLGESESGHTVVMDGSIPKGLVERFHLGCNKQKYLRKILHILDWVWVISNIVLDL